LDAYRQEVSPLGEPNSRHIQKDRPKVVLSVAWVRRDQTTRSEGPLCLRRYAMKPTPKKPRIIIAQVDGSGTAVVRLVSVVMDWVREKSMNSCPKSPLMVILPLPEQLQPGTVSVLSCVKTPGAIGVEDRLLPSPAWTPAPNTVPTSSPFAVSAMPNPCVNAVLKLPS
jgi:hypothetical protein